jgi:uncharacterized flavoprotein (TIGR03862 family)
VKNHIDAMVIGAGPAGLMAAHGLAVAGRKVVIADAKPSVGRKFLMAGKSGLNLTKDESLAKFIENFGQAAPRLSPMLTAFGPDAVADWARGLGQEVFVGSSGRVFPKAMKASPLLRAWMGQLDSAGIELRTRWRWLGWDGDAFAFDTPDGPVSVTAGVVILALGGGSWARLGSDGTWVDILRARDIATTPLAAANAGLNVAWSGHMARFYGLPVKGIQLSATGSGTRIASRGECVVSARGLEGGGIYTVSRALRNGGTLTIDLMPDWTVDRIAARIAQARGKDTLANGLRKALKLDAAKNALLMEFGRPLPMGTELARLIKALPINHAGLRPVDEAISTAGGVAWAEVDDNLMLRKMPGVFVAGEMLDWEAPTGGYLITGCLATGRWAANAAAAWR